MIVGLPGLAMALVVLLVLKDPRTAIWRSFPHPLPPATLSGNLFERLHE